MSFTLLNASLQELHECVKGNKLASVTTVFHFPLLYFVCYVIYVVEPKESIRKALFAALESEEDYIEAPNLLFKINLHFT